MNHRLPPQFAPRFVVWTWCVCAALLPDWIDTTPLRAQANPAAAPAGTAAAPAIPRILPPPGLDLPPETLEPIRRQYEKVSQGLQLAFLRQEKRTDSPLLVDIEVYLKAVEWALNNGEFFDAKDPQRALDLLAVAQTRLEQWLANRPAWPEQRGTLVRGYRSQLDDSLQPYGLVIPEKLELSRPVPLVVWLHGRGDKTTDLQFIAQRQASAGQVAPASAIVVHPFGRYCNGFKFAGEVDVLETIAEVSRHYPIDPQRIVLWGFSMGGAGAWQLVAHHADRFVAVSPGAGFAETARYQKLDPGSVPAYERLLWNYYDVPPVVRNLFNVPVIAYSGELDKQIQAARVMEEAYAEHQRKLEHLIGPGVEHKYHPQVLSELTARLERIAAAGRPLFPAEVLLQAQSLRHAQLYWVRVERQQAAWSDTRIDARRLDDGGLVLSTVNVAELSLAAPFEPARNFQAGDRVEVDQQRLTLSAPLPADGRLHLARQNGRWEVVQPDSSPVIEKRYPHGGPIDDAFLERFVVVLPTGKSPHPQVEQWVQAELAHFQDRWQRLYRGRVRLARDTEIDPAQTAENLVLWGDPHSNRVLAALQGRLPIAWDREQISAGGRKFSAAGHVLSLVYPNPLRPQRYVVVNSGPTYREGHDRSNSLQTPKLPDWAIIDLSQPPTHLAPGRIAAADFFDTRWQLVESSQP